MLFNLGIQDPDDWWEDYNGRVRTRNIGVNVDNLNEAELKAMTRRMYEHGGIDNALKCLLEMFRCQIIITEKIRELIKEHDGQ